MGSGLDGENLLQEEQSLSFLSWPPFGRAAEMVMAELLSLKVRAFTLNVIIENFTCLGSLSGLTDIELSQFFSFSVQGWKCNLS